MKQLMIGAIVALLLCATVLADTPPARSGHSIAEVGGRIFIFGGEDANVDSTLSDVWEFNEDTSEFSERTVNNSPAPRKEHAAAPALGKMYAFFGVNESGFLGDVHSFDPANDTWTEHPVNQPAPLPMEGHSAAAVDGENILVFGGFNSTNQPQRQLWQYNASTNTWTRKADMPIISGRFGHSAVVHNGKMYVFGGRIFEPELTEVNELWAYDIANDSWQEITQPVNRPPARAFQAVAQDGNKMWILGGENESLDRELQDVWELDLSTLQWTQRQDLANPVTNATAAVIKVTRATQLLMFGGISNGQPTSEPEIIVPDEPQLEPVVTNRVGSLRAGKAFLLYVTFPQAQERVNIRLTWEPDDVELLLNACGSRAMSSKQKLLQTMMPENQVLGIDHLPNLQKLAKQLQMNEEVIARSEKSRAQIDKTLTNVRSLVLQVSNRGRFCDEARNIVLQVRDFSDNPRNITYRFIPGGERVHTVEMPIDPVRFRTIIIPKKGVESTKSADGLFKWQFDEQARQRRFGIRCSVGIAYFELP